MRLTYVLKSGSTTGKEEKPKTSAAKDCAQQTNNKRIMHSTIIQLSEKPIGRCEWASEDDFYSDIYCKVDYCTLLDGEERSERINDLNSSNDLFSQIFKQGTGNEAFVFRGKKSLFEVRQTWIGEIRRALGSMADGNSFDTFRLLHAVNRPCGIYTLFCLPSWTGNCAVYPSELLEWLNTIEDGTTIYVGAVLDYHF